MRSLQLLLITLLLLFCSHTVTAAPRRALALRQDDNESDASATTRRESSPSSATSQPRESSTVPSVSAHQSATESSAPRSTVLVTSSTVSASPSTTASSDASANGTESASDTDLEDPLPLHPKITPALGLIGALFLITGALYAVIGIKNKWVYVFGSAAYLAALAVTVLIVYLMNPPVSNAIQGAFFVAAFITGILLGALALIFPDLTEGLGCLLGGFCIGMWFMSLKEGGLISSTGGRAIFIGCMSVASYSLSFSHYTRTYGLIGSISFSGATITILGVDCFSRAGWKEFWLYIWNLNPDIFPLGTTTYPMTKGLKAELAGVIILTIFGVISQLRLWKLIKERRAKREEQEHEIAETQQKQEAELGLQIEDKFQKERRQWEATYGEKSLPGSSDESGQMTPQSPSLYEKEYTASESESKADSARNTNKRTSAIVATVQEDEIQQIDATGTTINRDAAITPLNGTSRANSTRQSSDVVAAGRLSRSVSAKSSLKPSSPPPPIVIPLPFRVPQEDDAKSHISDTASVSAMPDVEEASLADPHSLARRLSGKPTMKRNSTARSSVQTYQMPDIAIISHSDDDRASSVAATLDEEDTISVREMSTPHSPVSAKLEFKGSATEESKDDSGVAFVEDAATSTPGTPTINVHPVGEMDEQHHATAKSPSPTQEGPSESLTISTDPKPDGSGSKRNSAQSSRLRHDTLTKNGSDKSQQSTSPTSETPPSSLQHDKDESIVEDFSKVLPARLSKVAQSYRTNEWAKHLESAEKPEVEEILEPGSPGAQLDHELPAPVSEDITHPFATAKRASKRVSSDNSNAHRDIALMQITSNSSRLPHSNPMRLSREASQSRVKDMQVSGLQQASTFDAGGRRISSGPVQLPSNTLMGKRESLIRNRASSQNFNQQVGLANDSTGAEEEDMTLAQRRRVLKHQKPPSASQKWKKSSWATSPQAEGFDSHQPKRTTGSGSDEKREELLAGWRGSAHQNGALTKGAVTIEEQQRAAMMTAKRQKEMEKQQQAIIAQQRESMRHTMMRSNEMLDAHRDAMRRMQAAANKKP